MAIIDNPDVTVTTDKNTVTATYKADEDSSLFFTIPYDKGWTVTQNGEKLKVSKAQDGFMKVDVKAGEGKVTLTYIPNGFKEGAYLSMLGIILFLAYMIARRKYHLRIKAG